MSNAVIPLFTDASGQAIPMEQVQVDPHQPFSFYENNMPWSYRTNRKAFTGPLTLSISSINIISTPPEFDFEIDLGSNPQVGQVWQVNRDFAVEGRAIHLQSIRLTNNPPTTCDTVGLEYEFKGDADASIMMTDASPGPSIDQVCSGGGGGDGPVDSTLATGIIGYRNIPFGVHHYSVSAFIPYEINGPWQVTWTPPLTSAPMPTPAAGACLTLDKWNQLSARNDPLPSGLGGKILTTADEGELWPAVYIGTLDGAVSTKVGTATWPSLSTDGTRLAYSVEDGIHIHN
ncbi:MAG: hypothetical protein KJZ72_21880, partial [Anaerolineales bacterium]|nr:hypothetical protein [Anaerolineales bacterium]